MTDLSVIKIVGVNDGMVCIVHSNNVANLGKERGTAGVMVNIKTKFIHPPEDIINIMTFYDWEQYPKEETPQEVMDKKLINRHFSDEDIQRKIIDQVE